MYRPTVIIKKKLDNGVDAFNVHDEEQIARPIIQTDQIVEQVNRKVRNDQRLTIRALGDESLPVASTTIYTVAAEMLR